MELEICKGDYSTLGTKRSGTVTTFTVENKLGKECFLILYSSDSEEEIKIPMVRDEKQTNLFSVGISHFDCQKYGYRYQLGEKLLLDPYARRILGREVWGDTTRKRQKIKAGLYPAEKFHWGKDRLPQIPKEDMVMYKLHIRGFSMLQKLSEKERGTFKGVERKLSYLKELGITTVEFMPIYEFEEIFCQDLHQKEVFPEDKINYWGYTRGDYFSLKSSYLGKDRTPKRFKQLVKKLHEKKMECILEFYFDEGLNPHYVMEVLHFWAQEYHVDGFHIICSYQLAELIAKDRNLSGRKLFFEGFPDEVCDQRVRAMELFSYNDGFLVAVRRVVNQQGGGVKEFAQLMKRQHASQGFVNYLASNNGFCLYDTFSYIEKKNQENGEGNLDGPNWNYSSNCGEEGPSKKRYVNQLREQRIKNALCALFFAQGVPMIWMGDECCNTQMGNNNPYCQDNEISWKTWEMNRKNKEMLLFLKKLAEIRKQYPALRNPLPMEMKDYKRTGYPDLSYHGEAGWRMDLEGGSQVIGMMYSGKYGGYVPGCAINYVYIGYNFSPMGKILALPRLPKKYHWFHVLDTSKEEVLQQGQELQEKTFVIPSNCVCVLVGRVEE